MAKRVKRTDEEKIEILQYADEHGPLAAEKKFKINRGQIYSWRSRFKLSGTPVTKPKKAKAKGKKATKKRLTAPESPRRGAAVTQARSSQRQQSEKRSKKVGIKALRHAAVLDRMANEAMNEDRTEEALALFAGASALRGKVTS